jgi:hypothetical protein
MPRFADVPLGVALRVETSTHVRYAMGDKLDTDVYDYDAGGDDGCPLLVLTPVDESRHVFRRGRRRGYAAAADASNWDFGWDWVTMTTLTTIQPRPPDTTTTRNNQIEWRREEEKERTSQGGGGSGKKGGGLRWRRWFQTTTTVRPLTTGHYCGRRKRDIEGEEEVVVVVEEEDDHNRW